MNTFIDFRSDTVTLPSDEMRRVIGAAVVGDDCYGEDPAALELEAHCANLFGKESAVFLPSGTMTNQVAVKVHTRPGDEVITGDDYHINYFESAQTSVLSSVCLNTVPTNEGLLTPADVERAIAKKYRGPSTSHARLLFLENTVCSAAGFTFAPEDIGRLWNFSQDHGIRVHIDGARILNACVKTGADPLEFGKVTDTVSICFAKGLGCPFGAVLVGGGDVIKRARKFRKWLGGGLHQAGFMASAATYILKSGWRDSLAADHARAEAMVQSVRSHRPDLHVQYGGTNIIMISTTGTGLSAADVVARARELGLLLFPWGPQVVRLVTHNSLDQAAMDAGLGILLRSFEPKA